MIAELISLALICSVITKAERHALLSSVLCIPVDLLKLTECLIALNVVVRPKS